MKVKRLIALILSLATIFCFATNAYAATGGDNLVMPCYDKLTTCRATLTVSGDNINVNGIITAKESCKVIATIEIRTASTRNSNNWEEYDTITYSGTASVHTFTDQLQNVPTGYYYAYMTVSVVGSSETGYATSSIVYVP